MKSPIGHEYPFDPLTPAQYERCAVMWADSKNTAEIASDLKVSEARVFNTMGQWMPRARVLCAVKRAALDAANDVDGKTLSVVRTRDHIDADAIGGEGW